MTPSESTARYPRMQLRGADRARYFAPVAFCVYLGLLCAAVATTGGFLGDSRRAVAIAAVGVFGALLLCLLGVMVWSIQRRELRFQRIETGAQAPQNVVRLAALAAELGWRVEAAAGAGSLSLSVPGSLLTRGERIEVRFEGEAVWIACICDPEIGFSLAGRARCGHHRARIRERLLLAQRSAQA